MDAAPRAGRWGRRLVAAVLVLGGLLPGPAGASATGTATPAQAKREADRLLARPMLTAPTTVTLTAARWQVRLDPARDYLVKVEIGTLFTRNVTIIGGRNVVLENAVLSYAPALGGPPDRLFRGLLLQDQTGVMWVRNLQIRGPLAEGIDLSQKRSAAVVLRDIRIDPVSGSQQGNHADLLQTWAGPARLVVDGLYGASNFQGVFLQPSDTWNGPQPKFMVLRRVHIDVSRGFYALSSFAHGAYPIVAEDVTVQYNPLRPERDQWLWPKPSTGDTTWQNVVGIGPQTVVDPARGRG